MNFKRSLLASVLLAVLAFLVHPPVVTAAETLVGTISVAGYSPTALITLNNKLYVANYEGTVSIINTDTNTLITTLTITNQNQDYVNNSALTTVGNKVYVLNYYDETIAAIDGTANTFETIAVPGEHYEIASANGKVYVANYDSSSVSVIDPSNSNAVTTITTPAQTYTIISHNGKVYAGGFDEKVYVIDPATDTIEDTVSVGGSPSGMAGLNDKIYVAKGNTAAPAQMFVIDTANNNSTSTITIDPGAKCLSCYGSFLISAYGTHVFVGEYNVDWIYIVDLANSNSVTSVAVNNAYSVIAYGDKGYVPVYTGDIVNIIDTANSNAVTTIAPANGAYMITRSGTRLYVGNWDAQSVSVIETDDVAPSVSLTSPSNGATVSGSVSHAATASDNGTLVGVQFKIDATNQGAEDTTSAYGISWDSTGVADGSHTIDAVARDLAGNYATSTITVTVDNSGAPAPSSGGGGSNFNKQKTFQPVTTYGPTTSILTVTTSPTVTTLTTIAPTQTAIPSPAISVLKNIFTKDLFFGMTDPEVRLLQTFLNTHGFKLANTGPGSPGKETNFFGAATRYQLIQFQKANKITPAAGYFGPKTRALVNELSR